MPDRSFATGEVDVETAGPARDTSERRRRWDLRGMFDGPTTEGLDLSSPLVVLDLSALYNSAALGVLMACATAWLQATLARQAGRTSQPVDEILGGESSAWFRTRRGGNWQ